ncbi:MAG: tRNA-dihydrouridine synthase [Candidatus Yonathbacteria bacterium]|nr:tRNA-dihydrouridine synthase [Candidatus Yonathbacteria bacterium]
MRFLFGKKNIPQSSDGNLWETLRAKERPFFALAPMADATDNAFREIIARKSHMGESNGGPDVMWTEFVSCDGLASQGRDILLRDLTYTEAQRPIVAQIFGGKPDTCFEAGKIVAGLGFDGIDINMGCPQDKIIKQTAGADLIRDPERAKDVVRAVREGVSAAGKTTPVSVKTRIGFNTDILDEWIPELLSLDLPALTVHARTRKEMSLVPARWERIARAVELRNKYTPNTLIIGNGDVVSIADGRQKAKETGADGIMIGRAVFGNPWIFAGREIAGISREEKIEALLEHTRLYEQMFGDKKNFAIMKKHYSAYVRGWDGAKELRMALMEAESLADVERIIRTNTPMDY